jgi:hypothetical protein
MRAVGMAASEQIRATLQAARGDADRIVAAGERTADERTALAAETDRSLAAARIEQLRELQHQIQSRQHRVEDAYTTMAEALAVAALRLAAAAREADFSSPPWPSGIGRTVEIKLAETREVTFRIETGGEGDDVHGQTW